MDLEATEAERKQLEYSTQFFEFTPDAFIDSVSATTVDITTELLEVWGYLWCLLWEVKHIFL